MIFLCLLHELTTDQPECSVAMSTDRMNMLNFTPFMQTCISHLRNSPEAAPTDRKLVAWVELQHLTEEVADSFRRNSAGTPSFNESATQTKLQAFGMKFEEWTRNLDQAILDGMRRYLWWFIVMSIDYQDRLVACPA